MSRTGRRLMGMAFAHGVAPSHMWKLNAIEFAALLDAAQAARVNSRGGAS